MIVRIGGNGSHLALLDLSRYSSFVAHDWARDNLLHRHFVEQMNAQCALVWATGFEASWRVEIEAGITSRKGFREFVRSIRNATDALYLANYDSLTMAAQFADYVLPDQATSGHRIPLASGLYRFRVVQLVDPDSDWWETLGENPAFRLEYEPTMQISPPCKEIPWAQ